MTATARLAGIELYFDDLPAARHFYAQVLALPIQEDQPAHHVQLAAGSAFVCLERKGVESYPSADKAVLFLEVDSLQQTLARIPQTIVMQAEETALRPWAAIRDPEGHTVLLLERPGEGPHQPEPAA